MASTLPISLFYFLSASLLLSCPLHHPLAAEVDDHFPIKLHEKPIMKEKISHFRVYLHDIFSGANPTSVTIVKPSKAKLPSFGQINMIDDPLTIGLESSSEVVGRAQGFFASASEEELGLLMAVNFMFTTGKYNGSSITILGRNAALDKVREMPVVGGSGLFRFAQGYVKARTRKVSFKTLDATVEYDVYVMHY